MNPLRMLVLLVFCALPLAAPAQSQEPATAAAAQFDFLLGQWQLEVHPKVSTLVAMIHGSPRLLGSWKARRATDGLGIEDELRIFDASGNPITLNKSRRTYQAAEARWKVTSTDEVRKRQSEATAKMVDGEMHLEGRFIDSDGKTTLSRTRYYDVAADGFHMQQDRSEDDGKSWDEAVLVIDAKRTSATATP